MVTPSVLVRTMADVLRCLSIFIILFDHVGVPAPTVAAEVAGFEGLADDLRGHFFVDVFLARHEVQAVLIGPGVVGLLLLGILSSFLFEVHWVTVRVIINLKFGSIRVLLIERET
jgi:hypothetical protein